MRKYTLVLGLFIILLLVVTMSACTPSTPTPPPAETPTEAPTPESVPPTETEPPPEEATPETEPSPEATPPPEEPELDGEALLEERCTDCHSLDRVAQRSYTREQWENTVDRMIDRHGAELDDEEREVVLDYLVENYGP